MTHRCSLSAPRLVPIVIFVVNVIGKVVAALVKRVIAKQRQQPGSTIHSVNHLLRRTHLDRAPYRARLGALGVVIFPPTAYKLPPPLCQVSYQCPGLGTPFTLTQS